MEDKTARVRVGFPGLDSQNGSPFPAGAATPPQAQQQLSQDPPALGRQETKDEVLGGGEKVGKNVEPIKTPFTFVTVKLYRDFSTQDMNSNHAFFSVTAKAANTREALCKQDNPWAPGPGQEAPEKELRVQAGLRTGQLLSERASWGLPTPRCSGRDDAVTGQQSLVHSNLQRPLPEPSPLLDQLRGASQMMACSVLGRILPPLSEPPTPHPQLLKERGAWWLSSRTCLP